MVRLKDLFNVNIAWDGEIPSFSYGGDSLTDARTAKAHIIQWLPAQGRPFPARLVLSMDGDVCRVCANQKRQKSWGKSYRISSRIGFVRDRYGQ